MVRCLTAAGAAFALFVGGAAQAGLVITEVAPQSSAGSASTINGDWWELTNTGPSSVNLAGYSWADTEDAPLSEPKNYFPSIELAAGQSVIILEEPAANLDAWRANWGLASTVLILGEDQMVDDASNDGDMFSGLGSSEDGVYLFSPALEVLNSYLYAQNTRGVSFEIAPNGTDLGLSVVGENGAVQALNGDIGSPGATVPEPAMLSLFGVGALALLARRRG